MDTAVAPQRSWMNVLEHDLNRYFPELLKFESTPEMEASELYQSIRPEVERILNAVVVAEPSAVATEAFADAEQKTPVTTVPGSETIHALSWNIERGNMLDGILDALTNHPQLKD